MANASENVDNRSELLTIRFTGPNLSRRSVAISDLGETFIAIQRIVNKAALNESGRLEKGARLHSNEKAKLALEIVSHRKSSDLWGLSTILSDKAFGPIVQGAIVAALAGVCKYVWKRVTNSGDTSKTQILVVNIFPEMRTLTNRIRDDGEIVGVELANPNAKQKEEIVVTKETQRYVKSIENEKVPGKRCLVVGQVKRLHPQSRYIDLEDRSGNGIRIYMERELFEKVRLLGNLGPDITLEGVPLYKLGNLSPRFDEFKADRLITR